MKAADFAHWVSTELLPEELRAAGKTRICASTAAVWLDKMGFDAGVVGKGIDLDVHERADVVDQGAIMWRRRWRTGNAVWFGTIMMKRLRAQLRAR
jgi:hypothetical protein